MEEEKLRDGKDVQTLRLDDYTQSSSLFIQICAISGCLTMILCCGMTIGLSAVILPQLKAKGSPIEIDEEQGSWIASLSIAATPVGSLLSSYVMNTYGIKTTQISTGIIWIVSWIIMGLTNNLYSLYIGRTLTGFSSGLATSVASVYLAEASIPKYRGIIMAGINLNLSLGIALFHLLGTFFIWRVGSFVTVGILVTACVFVLLSPESPSWLASRGLENEAKKSFFKLRGVNEQSCSEYKSLIENCAKSRAQNTRNNFSFSIFLKYEFLKPFIVLLIFFTTQQFSGWNFITYYTIYFFRDFPTTLTKYEYMLIIDLIRIVMSIVGCILLRKCARRLLTMVSCIGTIICLFGISLYFQGTYVTNSPIFPMLLVVLHTFFGSIGLSPLPFMMVGEIYPRTIREFGSGISICTAFILGFTAVKTIATLVSIIHMSGTFYLYTLSTTIGTILLYFCLPETKNLTLQQVEDSFIKRSNHNRRWNNA